MLAFPESADDRIRRALNDAKRSELTDKFGGVFIGGDVPLPAEIESEFLQRIEEFELKWAAHDITTVREFIGDPDVKTLEELGPGELKGELECLIKALEDNDIELDFAERPDDAEIYRFIVSELLDHEIDNIRVPGMVCHFLYEEFHPNAELEARYAAEWFLERLMTHREALVASLADRAAVESNGTSSDVELLRQNIVDFQSRVATIMNHELTSSSCTVSGDSAMVVAALSWSGLESGSMNEINVEGEARVRLRRRGGDWEVESVDVPGGW